LKQCSVCGENKDENFRALKAVREPECEIKPPFIKSVNEVINVDINDKKPETLVDKYLVLP
jgi:hypothetical protein